MQWSFEQLKDYLLKFSPRVTAEYAEEGTIIKIDWQPKLIAPRFRYQRKQPFPTYESLNKIIHEMQVLKNGR